MYSCKQVISFVSRFIERMYTIVERINFQTRGKDTDVTTVICCGLPANEFRRYSTFIRCSTIHYRPPHELSFVQVRRMSYIARIIHGYSVRAWLKCQTSVVRINHFLLTKKGGKTVLVTMHRQSPNSGLRLNTSAIAICLIIRASYAALRRNLMRIVHTASRWPDNSYYIIAPAN